MTTLRERYGDWALVTGASSGIGEAFARRLASEGINVVVAARRLDRLDRLAAELRDEHGVTVRTVQSDLSSAVGVELIEKAIVDIDLAIVINNAGSAHPGSFFAAGVDDRLDVVRLNVTTPVELAHLLGRRLLDRGRGAMIFTGSTAAFAGVPLLANYAATKAFIGTFAEGLNREWGPAGVDVLVVHPGPTKTEMATTDGVDFGRVPVAWMTADQVAARALGAVGRKPVLIPGVANKIQRFLFTRLLPRRTTSAIWGALMGRVTDDDRQAPAGLRS